VVNNNQLDISKKIILATTNQGKIREFTSLFSMLDIVILSLKDYNHVPDVVEDGDSFKKNAKKKAETICRYTGLPTIADDSGLVVDALGGAPGIFSARYAGEDATDEQNNKKLLYELRNIPDENRSARFVAYLALSIPGKNTVGVEDQLEGFVLKNPKGENGFGYDPLFYIPEYEKTMAEIAPEVKNQISHRGKAMKRLFAIIKNLDLPF